MLTVNELFSGIGAQSAALERLGIEFKVVGIAEIDKYAIKSYEAIHGPVRNYGDISKADKLDYADFWTYSFPCQDISVAGKQRGIEKGKTRSGLLYEVERLLERSQECNELPKYLMLENVKNLVGKKFKAQFKEWISKLDELGYNTYWEVLNAKYYGIPQNRERVFAISILKDIDTGYDFPKGFDNGKRLKDILEKDVDEKYYINNEKVNKILNSTFNQERVRIQRTDICDTLLARDYKDPKCVKIPNEVNQIGNIVDTGNWDNPQRGRIYSANGCSPALNCCGGGGLEPKVLIPQATKQGYIECNVPGVADLSFPDSKTRRGRVQDNGETCPTLMAGQQDICYIESNEIIKEFDIPKEILNDNERQRRVYNTEGISPTVLARVDSNKIFQLGTINGHQSGHIYSTDGISVNLCANGGGMGAKRGLYNDNFRIRKLTPLECWRLMGFTDEQFHKAERVNSNSQLYKQAGNSIVVDVLYYLFKNIFVDKPSSKDNEQLEGQLSIKDWLGA